MLPRKHSTKNPLKIRGLFHVGHTPSTAGTFRKKFRKNSGKTPETLSERFLEFPSRVRLGCPKPWHLRLSEHFQNSLPPSMAGGASFFISGSGEGLSELVMEFPAVLSNSEGISEVLPRKRSTKNPLGKILTGAHKRGLKPQIFRENGGEILPGKSGLFGANWGLFRADRGLFGADRDQFLRTPQPRGKSRNCPERALFGLIGAFGPSPPLLSPRLDFPDPLKIRGIFHGHCPSFLRLVVDLVWLSRWIRKGVGGRGLATNGCQDTSEIYPQILFPFS